MNLRSRRWSTSRGAAAAEDDAVGSSSWRWSSGAIGQRRSSLRDIVGNLDVQADRVSGHLEGCKGVSRSSLARVIRKAAVYVIRGGVRQVAGPLSESGAGTQVSLQVEQAVLTGCEPSTCDKQAGRCFIVGKVPYHQGSGEGTHMGSRTTTVICTTVRQHHRRQDFRGIHGARALTLRPGRASWWRTGATWTSAGSTTCILQGI